MTSKPATATGAAEAYCESKGMYSFNADEMWHPSEVFDAFLAGAAWARANNPEVLALREVVDGLIARYEDAEIRNPGATPLMKGLTLGAYNCLVKALAAFDKRADK